MYELIQLTERTYYIKSPTNIGLFRLDEKNVCLIDSGNDKDAGRRIRQVLDANGWQLTAIYNTHANADHIGGNRYLQGQTGCRIYAPGIDCAFTRHPVLEPSFLYGGYPPKDLRHKFLLAQESDAAELLSGLGIREALHYEKMGSLNAKEKVRVLLAQALFGKPDNLLLDEPTNHLDMQTLDWFEGFLAKYRGTVLMVSHDRRFLDRVATRTLILEDGICTSYPGGYTAAKEERERQMLLEFEQYKNQQKQIEAMKAAIKRFREWGAQADNPKFFRRAKMLELRLEKMEMIKRPQLEKSKIPMRFAGDRTGREVLKLTGFSLSFGKTALFEQAELLVEEKDRMAFLGANGTGKTSLLRAVFGDVPFSGTAKFNPSAQLGYIPQEIRFLNDKDSVLEAFRRECVCGEGEARQILAKYYFCGAAVMKRVSSLSGGEKVLLKLAVLLQNRVNFLILDEPTNHIDIETREMLEDALLEFSGTLLFISHDRYFIDKLATKIAVLENRKINVFDGTYADYLRVTGHA